MMQETMRWQVYRLLLLPLRLFNGIFSKTTWVSRHQKGKPFWILLEQEMMVWQWHQLDHMQIICTSLQTDSHASTSSLLFYRPDALPDAQPPVSKHWRHRHCTVKPLNETQTSSPLLLGWRQDLRRTRERSPVTRNGRRPHCRLTVL